MPPDAEMPSKSHSKPFNLIADTIAMVAQLVNPEPLEGLTATMVETVPEPLATLYGSVDMGYVVNFLTTNLIQNGYLFDETFMKISEDKPGSYVRIEYAPAVEALSLIKKNASLNPANPATVFSCSKSISIFGHRLTILGDGQFNGEIIKTSIGWERDFDRADLKLVLQAWEGNIKDSTDFLSLHYLACTPRNIMFYFIATQMISYYSFQFLPETVKYIQEMIDNELTGPLSILALSPGVSRLPMKVLQDLESLPLNYAFKILTQGTSS